MLKEVDAGGGGATRNTASSSAEWRETRRKKPIKRVRQKWDCPQIEDSFEEGDVMDWYEDDEI